MNEQASTTAQIEANISLMDPPTQGFPLWLLRFCESGFGHRVGIKYRPGPNRKELAQRQREIDFQVAREEREAFEAYVANRVDRLRFLASLGIQPIMSFCNIKSGTKTTNALYVGSVISEITRKKVLVVPATQNTATGTTAVMAGISSANSITVSQLSRDIKDYGAFRVLSSRVPVTQFGLAVVSEDDNNVQVKKSMYAIEEFRELALTILPNVDVLILDHGNDDIQDGSVVLEATRLSHVLNFAFDVTAPITRVMLSRTLRGYNTDTDEVDMTLDPNTQTGRSTSTLDKVAHSVVIATKTSPGAYTDFEALTTPEEQSVHASPLPKWQGTGVQVPMDDYIATVMDGETVSICDLNKIDERTYLQYLEIAVANFEEAARVQGITIPGEVISSRVEGIRSQHVATGISQ